MTTHFKTGPARTALVALALVVLVANCLYYQPYIVDDAFISFRYAAQLVAGNGLVFNEGEAVEGYSNFSWVLISALVLRLGLPIVATMKVIGVACAIGTALLSLALARRVFSADRPMLALYAFALLCVQTSLAIWSQAGLETAFFALLLVAACVRFEREASEPSRRPWSALVYGLAWLTRPEAPAYGLYFIARRIAARRRWNRRDVAWCLTLMAVVVPYELWGLWYYGELLPHTHAVKVGGALKALQAMSGDGLERSILYKFLVQQGPGFSVLCACGLIGCLARFKRVPAAAWATTGAGFAFVLYAWNDWMPRFRLLVPALPFVVIGVVFGVAELHKLAARTRSVGIALSVAWTLCFASVVQHQLFGGYFQENVDSASTRFAVSERGNWIGAIAANLDRTIFSGEGDAWFILTNLPEHETIAIPDIGFPGYVSMNPVWDIRGLVTPVAARSRGGGPEARAAAIEDLLERRPGMILLPSRGGKALGLANTFDKRLKKHPEVARSFERTTGPNRILYIRNDLTYGDPDTRIERALSRFPFYRAHLEQQSRR